MGALMWVAVGSALGGLARHWLSGRVARAIGEAFPFGTLAVNVSGAFAIGVLAALIGAGRPPSEAQALLLVGVLGSYTTVSSFSLQTLTLLRGGEHGRALANVALSLAGCLLAVTLGYGMIAGLGKAW